MKRMKKTLIGLLLSIMLVLGLIPTMAFADGENNPEQDPVNEPTFSFDVRKTVTLGGTAQAPYRAFYFELKGQDEETLENYGIDYEANDNAIETDGARSYDQTLTGTIDPEKVTAQGSPWVTNEDGIYTCQLSLKERNDEDANWVYDHKSYILEITYNKESRTATTQVYYRNADANTLPIGKAYFTNTYTGDRTNDFTIPVIKTVKQGGTAAPGKQDFTFELKKQDGTTPADYGITMTNTTVTTDGAGTFEGTLTGTVDPDTVTTRENNWASGNDRPFIEFLLTEKNDGVDGWTYSDQEYSIVIYYDQTHGAWAKISEKNNDAYYDNAAFTNTFTKDKAPEALSKADPAKPQAPKTGDDSNQMLWIMLLLGSGAAAAALVIFSRRRKSVR